MEKAAWGFRIPVNPERLMLLSASFRNMPSCLGDF